LATRRIAGRWIAALLATAIGGGVAWFAWSGGDAAPLLRTSNAASASSAERAGASDRDGGNAARGDPDEDRRAGALEASRSAEAVDPLATPEPSEIDAIESEGRALLWGVVHAPDSQPCAGATIRHDGKVVATSDERGRYRVAVEQRTWESSSTSRGFAHWLHARKAGVGVAQQWSGGASRRVDLVMHAGCAISGRVRQRDRDAPVAGARVEFSQPMISSSGSPTALVSIETTSDGDGRFAFDALLGGRIALRATAAEWASCGWFEFDVDGKRGRQGIDFELEPLLAAKGWFVPWPPAGVERAEATRAQIAAIDAQVASPTTVAEPERAPIAEDGTFTVRFAATAALELRLELAGGVAWRRNFDLPREPRDLDLGRIELAAPARVRGELALPPELLELGFEFGAVVDAADGPQTLRATVGSDGRFVSPPLPPGRPGSLGILLGDAVALRLSLRRRDEATGEMVGVGELAAGETRDLGRVVPKGALLAGRVVDPRGGPTADSAIVIAYGEGDEAGTIESWADAKGRWLLALADDGSPPWLFELAGSAVRVVAARHAVRAFVPLPRPMAGGVFERVDLVLGDGERASGRVVDERGEPRRHAQLQFLPSQEVAIVGRWPVMIWTDGDGRFSASGLAPGKWRAFEYVDGGMEIHPLDAFVVPCADVTLKRRSDPEDGE